MNAKEQWINDTENSLQGLKAVEPNPYLYSKIMNRMQSTHELQGTKKLVWLTVSSLIVLAVLNLLYIQQVNSSSVPSGSDVQVIANQYQLLHTSTLNYQ